MLENPTRDRRAERRAATIAEIVEAAWDLCRANGLAALSLRDLARQVGLQAPSLYSYFSSKNAIYDAMCVQGYREFAAHQPELPSTADPVAGVREVMRYYVDFCTADPVRYQLLFQRTIPGFEPSPSTFEISVDMLRAVADWFTACGMDRPGALDLFSALGSGIAAQQNSNEPGGDRWSRLVDDAAVMFVAHILGPQNPSLS